MTRQNSTGAIGDISFLGTYQYNGTLTNTTVLMPISTSSPVNTQGVQVLSFSLTPKRPSSLMLFEVSLQYYQTTASVTHLAAMFRTSGSTICIGGGAELANANQLMQSYFQVVDAPASISSLTYSLRYGPDSGANAQYINGTSANQVWGTSFGCKVVAWEILQ